jgi:hypothetical protein
VGRPPGPDTRGAPDPVSRPTPGEVRFWSLAERLLEEPGITRSTMMGFPCLRIDGRFFATCDHRSGALVVKLPEERVHTLVDAGHAESFAPAGRPFREWASIPSARSRTWSRLLAEALDFVATQPAPATRARKPRATRD